MPSISSALITKALIGTTAVNCIAGILALAMPDLYTVLIFGLEGQLEGLTLRYHYIIWLFVLAMGLGCGVAARNPEEQTALILASGVGKAVFALICAQMLFSGQGTFLLLVAVVFDGVLGLLFLAYSLPLIFGNSPRSVTNSR
jgi:hypothetical protein